MLRLMLTAICLCIGAAAIAATPPAVPVATPPAAAAAPATAATIEQRTRDAEAKADAADRRALILEARSQLEDKAYSRFEGWIGIYGILFTLIVLGLGYLSHRLAILEVAKGLKDQKDEIAALLDTAKSNAAQVALSADEATTHLETVKKAAAVSDEFTGQVRSDDQPSKAPSDQQIEIVTTAAALTETKPEASWSIDEFKAQTAKALLIDKNWPELLRLSQGMAFIHGSDPDALSVALFRQARALGELDRSAEAIAAYDDLITRFGTSPAPALQEQVAKALVNKGVTLGTLNRSAEEIAVYDDLIARFGTSPALQEQVAMAMVNKGITLGTLNRSAEAIAVFDDLIARFGTSPAPALQERVAKALFNKGITLGTLDRSAEEIAVYDDLIARFGTRPALQEQVAKAMVNKGVTLGTLNRSAEAIAVYDDLIARFGTSPAPALQEQVAGAQHNRAIVLKQADQPKPRRRRRPSSKP